MYKYRFIFQDSLEGDIQKGDGSKELGIIELPFILKTGDSITLPEEWFSMIKTRFSHVNTFSFWVGSVIYHIDDQNPSVDVFVVHDYRSIQTITT